MSLRNYFKHPLFDHDSLVNLKAVEHRRREALAAVEKFEAAQAELLNAAQRVADDLVFGYHVSDDSATREQLNEQYKIPPPMVKRATTPGRVPTVLHVEDVQAVYQLVAGQSVAAGEGTPEGE